MFVRSDVGVLHYVLSFANIAQNSPSHAVEALVVTAHDNFKHPRLARQHSGHNFFVTQGLLRGRHLRWLLIATALGIWAANAANPAGIWGASRHALTVGFIAMMVFCIGQRVLPAFSGMRLLFSPKLMFVGLLLLSAGCLVRVSGEVLAYQEIVSAAWVWLPYSAILELSAVTVFATNLFLTFIRDPVTPQSTIARIRLPLPVEGNTLGSPHNPKVGGSNPPPATKSTPALSSGSRRLLRPSGRVVGSF